MNNTETMKQALILIKAQQEWIQAVPKDIPLPAMPGFDGDWADDVVGSLRAAIAQPDEPETATPTDAELLAKGWAIGHYAAMCRRCSKLHDLTDKRSAVCRDCASDLVAKDKAYFREDGSNYLTPKDAQPESEPYGYCNPEYVADPNVTSHGVTRTKRDGWTPLYAAPVVYVQPERKRVGDSKFESWYSETSISHERKQAMREAYEAGMNDAIAQPESEPAECKEGCPPQQICDYCQGTSGKDKVLPESEPVAWSYELATSIDANFRGIGWQRGLTSYEPSVPPAMIRNLKPLYAAPVSYALLSDDRLSSIWDSCKLSMGYPISKAGKEFGRAIERAVRGET